MKTLFVIVSILLCSVGHAQVILDRPKKVVLADTSRFHWDTVSKKGPNWVHLIRHDLPLEAWYIGGWMFFPRSPEYIIAQQIDALQKQIDSLFHPVLSGTVIELRNFH